MTDQPNGQDQSKNLPIVPPNAKPRRHRKVGFWGIIRGWLFAPKNDDEILELETNRPRTALFITLIGVSVFIVWAAYAELDQVTRAQGSVIASSRSQILQSVDGGVLQELLVKEGDIVEANQLIARLDRAKVEAGYLEARAKAAALRINVARLRAEVLDKPLVFDAESERYPQFRENQRSLFQRRQSAIREELSALDSMLTLAKQELAMTEPLLKTGDVSRSDVLRLQRQVADLTAQITNRRNKYFQDSQAELNKAEEELAGVEQIVAQRKEQLDSTEIRSPMRGTVKNIRITTRGGVLRAGEELMQIVPLNDELIIEAKVRPADIGFLKTGLDAAVKIDAFDYTIYGNLEGKVTFISADTLKEESNRPGQEAEFYRVRIEVENKSFSKRKSEPLALQPGMTATVEIKTGSNTVLRYITKPVIKTVSESMGER